MNHAAVQPVYSTGKARVEAGLTRLAADLKPGRWQREHGGLLETGQLDLGYRLITAKV